MPVWLWRAIARGTGVHPQSCVALAAIQLSAIALPLRLPNERVLRAFCSIEWDCVYRWTEEAYARLKRTMLIFA